MVTSGLQPPVPCLLQVRVSSVCLNGCSARLRCAFEEVVDLGVVAKPTECSAHRDSHFLFEDVVAQVLSHGVRVGYDRFGATEAKHGHPRLALLDDF